MNIIGEAAFGNAKKQPESGEMAGALAIQLIDNQQEEEEGSGLRYFRAIFRRSLSFIYCPNL